jgi:DNA-binding MarR family transcriptional regulator
MTDDFESERHRLLRVAETFERLYLATHHENVLLRLTIDQRLERIEQMLGGMHIKRRVGKARPKCWRVILQVLQREPMTRGDLLALPEMTGFEESTASAALKSLERDGFVSRGRSRLWSLTTDGLHEAQRLADGQIPAPTTVSRPVLAKTG